CQRRYKAEEKYGGNQGQAGESEHVAIEVERQLKVACRRRKKPNKECINMWSNDYSQSSSGKREHGAFGKQLPDQSRASRAQRKPDADFFLARLRTRQQHIRNVGDCDQ